MIRIGPKMHDVVSYVRANPGRAMYHAAAHVAPCGRPGGRPGICKYGYRTVHRALAAGIVRGVAGPRGSTLLYPCETSE